MEYMDWSSLCRVCLQEDEMRSIYDIDEDITICDKIFKCFNITIKQGMNLPEQICTKCLGDLHAAYRFRTNCESSDAILQSVIDGHIVTFTDLIVSPEDGDCQYAPGQEQSIKCIGPPATKIEFGTPETISEQCSTYMNHMDQQQDQGSHQITAEAHLQERGNADENQMHQFQVISTEEIETLKHANHGNGLHPGVVVKSEYNVTQYELEQNGKICTMKSVRNNKPTNKSNKEDSNVALNSHVNNTEQDGDKTISEVRINTDENKPFACDLCGNTYKKRYILEGHMRRHRNERPFACDTCGRAFVTNSELIRHSKTHNAQRPSRCKYCEKEFPDYASRINHERTHTGEKPYTCDTCGKSFAFSHTLASHIRTHTGEKPFGCNECGKQFGNSNALRKHIKIHTKNQEKNEVNNAALPPDPTNFESEDSTIVLD